MQRPPEPGADQAGEPTGDHPVTPPPEATAADGGTTAAGDRARSGGGRHFRARHVRRWPRRLLITANVVVFVLIAGAASVAGYAVYEVNQIHRVHVRGLETAPGYVMVKGKKLAIPASDSPPFTVLLVGSDSRVGESAAALAANSENLSDSIILARVSPATHQAALLSIPRDLWVSIPGMGMGKINAAFAGGDPTRLIQVIEQDLGIPVNHFAEVSFNSFEQIADDIGGVEQYFPTSAYDIESDLYVPKAGCVNLKGAQALAFVRSRHYYYTLPGQAPAEQQEPESDLGRIQRQQAFIKNALDKIKREGDLTNPLTLSALVSTITRNLTVDSTFSDTGLISLAEAFSQIDVSAIPNMTYPVVNYNVDGTDALTGIPSADAAVVAQFESIGTVAPKATTATTTGSTGRGSSTSDTSTSGSSTGGSAGTAAPSTTTTVPHATISVTIENGSGTTGQAGQAASDLGSLGYTVAGSADAASYGYATNVVEYGPDGLAAAQTLRDSLAGGATLTADASLSGDELVLVTGADWAGTVTTSDGATSAAGTGAAPTTTVPATTTTLTVPPSAGTVYGSSPTVQADSSSYVNGEYIPPGRLPGQKVLTCGN